MSRLYYCPRCSGHRSEPVCCGGEFITGDPAVADAWLAERSERAPQTPPGGRIGVLCVAGHWGDAMVSLAYAKSAMDSSGRGQKQCDALVVSPDPDLKEFVAAQPFIRRAHSHDSAWAQFAGAAVNGRVAPETWFPRVKAGVPELKGACGCRLFVGAIPNYWTPDNQPRVTPIRFELPKTARNWAWNCLEDRHELIGARKPVLLHPSSTWSAGQGMHWQHWPAAVRWLLDNTDETFLVTGLNPLPWLPDSPRIINAVGACPTNLEHLALAELCGRAVTTCNSVALWAASQGFPALIVGNDAIGGLTNVYRRYFERAPNVFLPVDAPLRAFSAAAGEFLVAGTSEPPAADG